MGVWGPNLYDNDCTADIQNSFRQHLEQGISPAVIKQILLNDYSEALNDLEEGPLMKLAIADQLRILGELGKNDRDEAMKYLLQGGDLEYWKDRPSELIFLRQKEISRLTQLFEDAPYTKRTASLSKKQIFPWSVGQLYALPLCSQDAIDLGLEGEYLLLFIFAEGVRLKGESTPLVWAKLTRNRTLPQSENEFNQLDYVQIACTAMEDRYRPFQDEKSVPIEYKQEYMPDQWGYLPEFSMTISETRSNRPPKSLMLLGDFHGIDPPVYDYRRYRSAHGAVWKHLEEYVLLRYRIHNLRQGAMYHLQCRTEDGSKPL